jgi:hypothetical protein
MDALLLSDVDVGGGAWLGDGLQYEPDDEPVHELSAASEADKPAGAGCGAAGKCGAGAQFADMEALAAAGGCCRGEAGASSCCRVAQSPPPAPDAIPREKVAAVSLPALAPMPVFFLPVTAPSGSTASSLACGCSDGNCSGDSSDANLPLKSMRKEGDGDSSDSTASSSSSLSAKHHRSTASKAAVSNGKDKQTAPRTRKRRSHLAPEERAAVRREQHRETMRRSRQRFRDRIDAMKETVERLEAVKANAVSALELSASVSEAGSIPTYTNADESVLRDQLEYLEREEQQLVREKSELHAQVVQSLLEIVASHPSNFRAATSANRSLFSIGTSATASGDASAAGSAADDDSLTLCDFVTWDVATIGHCLALVRDSYAEISHFYATVAGLHGFPTAGYGAFGPGSGDHHHPDPYSSSMFRSGLELMGWHDHRRLRGDSSNATCLEFAFEKLVPAADPRELFIKTWLFCRDQQSFASMFSPAVAALELEVLHEIHDDLVVVRRMQQEEEDVAQPDEAPTTKKTTKFRSIDLLYRIDAMDEGDDDGWSYVVFRSINPSFVQSCGCAGNAWFDSYMWFGFARGVGGSRVRFGGTLDGHSRAFALRWMLGIFFVLLRWESANVAPLLLVP